MPGHGGPPGGSRRGALGRGHQRQVPTDRLGDSVVRPSRVGLARRPGREGDGHRWTPGDWSWHSMTKPLAEAPGPTKGACVGGCDARGENCTSADNGHLLSKSQAAVGVTVNRENFTKAAAFSTVRQTSNLANPGLTAHHVRVTKCIRHLLTAVPTCSTATGAPLEHPGNPPGPRLVARCCERRCLLWPDGSQRDPGHDRRVPGVHVRLLARLDDPR